MSEDFNTYPNNIFDLVDKIGYDQIVLKIHDGTKVKFHYYDLLPPVDAITNTIAAATNYPEH